MTSLTFGTYWWGFVHFVKAAATDALLEKVPKPVYEKWGRLKDDARSKYGTRPARLKGMPAHQLPHVSEAQLLLHMLPVQLLRESLQRANAAHQNLHLTLHEFFKWLGLWLLMSLCALPPSFPLCPPCCNTAVQPVS